MRINADVLYDETLTVINRLDARDAGLESDEYRATVLHGCMWYSEATRSVQSDGTVIIGTVHKVQIPETADYAPYKQWSALEDRSGRFTLRSGDYVIKGEVSGVLTAAQAKRAAKEHEPDAFQVQHFRDLTKAEGLTRSNVGLMRFAECYYIEG